MYEPAGTPGARAPSRALRVLACLVAALPIWPRLWVQAVLRRAGGLADRAALGEVTPRWGFDQWTSTTDEPMHLLSRLVHLAALHVPGATVGSVIWINLVCLLVLVDAIPIARRSICGDGPFIAAFLLFALWFASPSWGATWLHGERVGALLAAAMFAVALRALHEHGRLALGAGVVLLALAPLHTSAPCSASPWLRRCWRVERATASARSPG